VPEEQIWLDEYIQGNKDTSAASVCARELETSTQAKDFFGPPLEVKRLTLYCDLVKSADCSAPVARAEFAWAGANATVELPCSGGKLAFTKELEQARDFVASKPVRMAVKFAGKQGVRLWPAWGAWRLEGPSEQVPRLEFTPGKAVIEARSVGAHGPAARAFWKSLGLDTRKLSKGNETEASLDFAGKRVK